MLRGAGFDASVGRSFALVEREGNECPNATLVLDQAIYLPFYPQMPAQELVRMAQVVRQVELPTKAQSERLQTEVLQVADRIGSTPEFPAVDDR